MSRMTKYLKQRCSLERFVETKGVPKLNKFGEIQYQPAQTVRCRRESSHKDVQTANGSIVRSTARYFLDESVPVKVDYRIDGATVVSVVDYINNMGIVEGYEVYV